MSDSEWQAFLEQFPIEYRSMLEDTEFQDSVIQIYADSSSEDEARTKMKMLIEQKSNETIEFEIWKRTHPIQWSMICTKSMFSVLLSRIKSKFFIQSK